MFVALTNHAPKIETRRALVLLNMQNDSFGVGMEMRMVSTEMVDKAKIIIPAFRKLGDIVWVSTEIHTPLPENATPKDKSNLSRETNLGFDYYFASSRDLAVQKQNQPGEEPRHSTVQDFESDDTDDTIANYLERPHGNDLPLMYVPGSRGAQIKDDLQPFLDPKTDLQLIKRYYSAFDSTPLLMSLRMKMVTHIYLAGTMTNVSVYATAADAVRHGFEVTVVEDCLGTRSEVRHVEAMGKMADILGVSGADSEEIVAEAMGDDVPPDADETIFSGPGLEGIASQKPSDALRPPPPLFKEGREKETSDERNSLTNRSGQFGSPQERTTNKMRSPQGSNELTEYSTPSVGERSPKASMKEPSRREKSAPHRECGPGDRIGEGDSDILLDALSSELETCAFDRVRKESEWLVMHHLTGEVPRRVAVQGEIGEKGSVPIYRHPADEAPPLLEFTPMVQKIREELQMLLKQPFNHVLIQLYRSGEDYISEHSDKTLDVVRGSSIINLSLGAQRNMTLRIKKPPKSNRDEQDQPPREAQRIIMPHNSVFVLGWRTNQKWLHSVRPDRRPRSEKTDAELAYDGERISLTFRHIGTFVSSDRRRIWGQGARSKRESTPGEVSATNSAEMEAMITAFGHENHQTEFDWDAEYGRGFDVLNLVAARSTLYLCEDELANLRTKMCVLHVELDCKLIRGRPIMEAGKGDSAVGSQQDTASALNDDAPVFSEMDSKSAPVEGDLAILFYLNKLYPTSSGGDATSPPTGGAHPPSQPPSRPSSFAEPPSSARRVKTNLFSRITQANELLYLWQELLGVPLTASTRATHQVRRLSSSDLRRHSLPKPLARPHPDSEPTACESFEGELAIWEDYAAESTFIAGEGFGIVDCAFWPVLDEVVRRWQGWSERRYPQLANYWRRVGALDSTRKALTERAAEQAAPAPGAPQTTGSGVAQAAAGVAQVGLGPNNSSGSGGLGTGRGSSPGASGAGTRSASAGTGGVRNGSRSSPGSSGPPREGDKTRKRGGLSVSGSSGGGASGPEPGLPRMTTDVPMRGAYD